MKLILSGGVFSGCASMSNTGKGAMIGAGGGAALGAGIGALAGKGKGAAIGAAVGAAVGSGTGALIGRRMVNRKKNWKQSKVPKLKQYKTLTICKPSKSLSDNGILICNQ